MGAPDDGGKEPALMSLPAVILAGGLSGFTSRFATHPFDTVKTQMQVQGVLRPSPMKYKGVVDGAFKIFARDGPAGFYRGFGAVITGVPFASGAYFGGYETSKALMPESLVGATASYVGAGMVAQAAAGVVYTPMDVVKVRGRAARVMHATLDRRRGAECEPTRRFASPVPPRAVSRGAARLGAASTRPTFRGRCTFCCDDEVHAKKMTCTTIGASRVESSRAFPALHVTRAKVAETSRGALPRGAAAGAARVGGGFRGHVHQLRQRVSDDIRQGGRQGTLPRLLGVQPHVVAVEHHLLRGGERERRALEPFRGASPG